jgi:hypothetical protein
MHRQLAHPLPDLRRRCGERVVVVQLEPKHARCLRCTEPAGVQHAERDRHLPEDVAGHPLADQALHAVGEPEHLDPTLEEAEQRPRVTLVHGGLAGSERDVRHDPGQPVALGRLEIREDCDLTDLLRRHHEMHHPCRLPSCCSRWSALGTTKWRSPPVPLNNAQASCTAFIFRASSGRTRSPLHGGWLPAPGRCTSRRSRRQGRQPRSACCSWPPAR